MNDEEIIAIRKAQVGRYGACDVTKPYSDSIAFARALLSHIAKGEQARAAGGDEVLIRLTRPEGYEDVHPDLVLQDACINPAFQPELVAPTTAGQQAGGGEDSDGVASCGTAQQESNDGTGHGPGGQAAAGVGAPGIREPGERLPALREASSLQVPEREAPPREVQLEPGTERLRAVSGLSAPGVNPSAGGQQESS